MTPVPHCQAPPGGQALALIKRPAEPAGRHTISRLLLHTQFLENAMPLAILTFRLPQEQAEFDAAMQGPAAKALLWDIDQYCRGMLKHGQLGDEAEAVARHIRQMIAEEAGLVE